MFDLCIKNGHIIDDVRNFKGAIIVHQGKIVALLADGIEIPKTKEVYDATGKYLLPGAIDSHSHLNDPGQTNSENFYTGTSAAAAGGITTVLEHPLTDPLPDNMKDFTDKYEIVDKKAVVDYCLWGACSPSNSDEITKMIDFGAIGFKAFIPKAPEIPSLSDGEMLKHMRQFAKMGTLLAIHCENDEIIQEAIDNIDESQYSNPLSYSEGRPPLAEIESVNRAMFFAKETGARTHVVHCSTPEAVDIVNEYKAKGADVTVETCIHYLAIDKSILSEQSVYAVCNPPLRSKESNERMWERIFESKIDCIGSDHAPYTVEEKMEGKDNIFNTPAGFTGIQTYFPMLFSEGVFKRNLSIHEFIKITSTNTAKIFNLYPKKGSLSVGSDADIVVFDKGKKWRVKGKETLYMVDWTPYEDMEITGAVVTTFVRGTKVYDNNEIVVEPGFGDFIRGGYSDRD